jgi:hypothetical protein
LDAEATSGIGKGRNAEPSAGLHRAARDVAGEVAPKIAGGGLEPYEILSWRDDVDGAL